MPRKPAAAPRPPQPPRAPNPPAPSAPPTDDADVPGGGGEVDAGRGTDTAFEEQPSADTAFDAPVPRVPAAPGSPAARRSRDVADYTKALPEERAGFDPETGESSLNFRGTLTTDHVDVLAALYSAHLQQRPHTRPVAVPVVQHAWQRLQTDPQYAEHGLERPSMQFLTELTDSGMIELVGGSVRFPDKLAQWFRQPVNAGHMARFKASLAKLGTPLPKFTR